MILVTGAAGFIGSCLVEGLRESIICCDPANDTMLTSEACIEYLRNNKVECVYHLGAISSTTETDLVKLTHNNIIFSSELLEICIEKKIPFIYASSASVYGSRRGSQKEHQPLNPLNYYAISKTFFDMYVLQKIKDNAAAHIIGLRYFNVYGHREHHKADMASPVHKFIQQVKSNGRIQIFEGSENFKRDFIHINDVVAITLASRKFTNSGIYNVGTGTPRSFRDVAEIISEKFNAQIIEIPFPEHLKEKYQYHTESDNEKIASAGYFAPRLSLEQGIEQVLKTV